MFSLVIVTLAALSGTAAPVRLESGPERVHLIELFTSEGCSSCPPAEKWLGELRQHDGLWRRFVPVAFHVSYWDRLGWRDRFSAQAFTDRQYALAQSWNTRTVYTPCFVRNGAEWRSRDLTAVLASAPEPAGRLVAEQADPATWRIEYTPLADRDDARFEVHVAWLGGGAVSDVRAGENSGRTLQHEFVVLQLVSESLKRGGAPGAPHATTTTIPTDSVPATPRHAIAVWVTRVGDLTPVQALGGEMPSPRR
jgi:hypothetical protein